MKPLHLFAFTAVLSVCAIQAFAQTPADQTPADQRIWFDDARTAIGNQDYKMAAKAARQIAASTASIGLQLEAGDILLRCGESKAAIKQFEKFLKVRPADRPHLWQLGIALYFDNQYAEAAKLFEIHRQVNPNDVENAAWHFLCVAKKDSADQAKKLLLPAPGDPRPPMAEVLAMLGSGDTESVKKRMESFPNDPRREKSAKFYGHFYLGLYADAIGDHPTAQTHLDAAAKDAPKNYMGDIAKVYARHLRKSN